MIVKPRFMITDLHDNDWIGVVINNQDPLFQGRAKIRVFRLMDDIEDEDLPWAVPINSIRMAGNGAGSLSVPFRLKTPLSVSRANRIFVARKTLSRPPLLSRTSPITLSLLPRR